MNQRTKKGATHMSAANTTRWIGIALLGLPLMRSGPSSNRNRPATTRTIGLLAAIGGALIGEWLGFNATQGLAALATTIVGAVVGANLLLLALDLGSAWPIDERATDRNTNPNLAGPRAQENPS
jgi:hypothetical protein